AYCDELYHKLIIEEEKLKGLPEKYRRRIRAEAELMELLNRAHKLHELRVEAGSCFVPATAVAEPG
ncbi:MAG: hypothetical protein ABW046_05815, partial [Actinoplanes sp.]